MSGKTKIKNIILVLKSGGDFSLKDVMLLSDNLYKTTDNIQIHCLTDIVSRKMIINNVMLIPLDSNLKGWWNKLLLFSPKLSYLRPFLYFDLDTIILKDITDIIPNDNDKRFIALIDWYKTTTYNSSMMWIPNDNEKVQLIWERWDKNPVKNAKDYRGDQEFMLSVTKPDSYWQDTINTISNFKHNRMWRNTYPDDLSIVCFHGKPRIFEAAKKVKWVKDYIYGKKR